MSDAPSVYGCDHPTARRSHKCYECRGGIAIGERYNKHHGIWDGEACTFKVCADCEALRSEVDAGFAQDDLTPFGSLCETVFDSRNPDFIRRFMDTKRKRGAEIRPWMTEREEAITP